MVTGHDVLKDDVTGRMHDDHRASLGGCKVIKKRLLKSEITMEVVGSRPHSGKNI